MHGFVVHAGTTVAGVGEGAFFFMTKHHAEQAVQLPEFADMSPTTSMMHPGAGCKGQPRGWVALGPGGDPWLMQTDTFDAAVIFFEREDCTALIQRNGLHARPAAVYAAPATLFEKVV